MNAKQERIKRLYPPFNVRNENSFCDLYIYIYIFEHILTGIRIEKQKIVRRFTQEIKFGQGFQNTK